MDQGDCEALEDRPVVVHLGNMPIDEEDRYTRAELKRRFAISERLRADMAQWYKEQQS